MSETVQEKGPLAERKRKKVGKAHRSREVEPPNSVNKVGN
jgi:hypothetical protein